MRLIDAEALEQDGWYMSRTVQINKTTMEYQTRKPTDFPAIEPERKKGKWYVLKGTGLASCECGHITDRYSTYNFCPVCGAKMER